MELATNDSGAGALVISEGPMAVNGDVTISQVPLRTLFNRYAAEVKARDWEIVNKGE